MLRLFDPRRDDAAALAALHGTSFPQAWSAAFIRDLLAGPGVFAFVRQDGFILARAAGGEAEILTLAVTPKSRRGGTGRALVRQAATHAQGLGAGALFLEVAKDNEAALKLYSGLGFKPVGLRKAYFDGKDAQVMKVTLPLPNPALPIPDDFA
ncbi:MAG TPA: GNAT family N-acetyltransferase [Rhizomicrobium sp.]|jgi:ribosomal-protein-alanine N-acetyltransferase|nr:GNAT family N-acetyltransferase [Rhizomicrobium sp.]